MLSVIIPVYQADKFLNRCVDSVLSQTYVDLEVILIDDGSTDNSGRICDTYASLDKRVRVLHKSNAGVAAARNSGLDMAVGEYITFVDSDDYIEPNMYQSLIDVAQNHDCDIVMCDCLKEFPDRTEVYSHHIREGYYNKEQLRREYFPHLLMMENVEYPATISNCVLVFKQNLKSNASPPRYVEGVRFSEDLLFGAQLLYGADSFYYMKNAVYYHYCMNPCSATHTFTIDKWNDYVKLHNEIERSFLNCKEFDFGHQINLVLLFFVYNAVGDIKRTDRLDGDDKLSMVKKILTDEKVEAMFCELDVWKLPIAVKLKLLTCMYKYKIGLRFLIKSNK